MPGPPAVAPRSRDYRQHGRREPDINVLPCASVRECSPKASLGSWPEPPQSRSAAGRGGRDRPARLCCPTSNNEGGAEQNPAQAEEHVRDDAVDPVAIDPIRQIRPHKSAHRNEESNAPPASGIMTKAKTSMSLGRLLTKSDTTVPCAMVRECHMSGRILGVCAAAGVRSIVRVGRCTTCVPRAWPC